MTTIPSLLFLLAAVNSVSSTTCPCDFAWRDDLDASDFAVCLAQWEGKGLLTNGVGWHSETGLTYDGHALNSHGMPEEAGLHNFSAPSKESIHLGLLALAVEGNQGAKVFFESSTPSTSPLDVLDRKLAAYERFNEALPGYGGFLPWFTVDDNNNLVPTDDWVGRVPSLDNGEWYWGLTACLQALRNLRGGTLSPLRGSSSVEDLIERLESYIAVLNRNAVLVFYSSDGEIRTVSTVKEPTLAPSDAQQVYAGEVPCGTPCYLTDPYEGEMFVLLSYLFGDWSSFPEGEREKLWTAKRPNVQRASYAGVTVQQGWWFSSHEAWKYMMLPYTDIPVQRELLHRQEWVRTRYSADMGFPGLYASVTNVTGAYLSATGVPNVASQPVDTNYVVTPYASYPVMLANLTAGVEWMKVMLRHPQMQGPMGTTESVSIDGQHIAPLVTWDSGATTVLAALGGVGDLNFQYLKEVGAWSAFEKEIDSLYGSVFPDLVAKPFPHAPVSPTTSLPRPDPHVNPFCQSAASELLQ